METNKPCQIEEYGVTRDVEVGGFEPPVNPTVVHTASGALRCSVLGCGRNAGLWVVGSSEGFINNQISNAKSAMVRACDFVNRG